VEQIWSWDGTAWQLIDDDGPPATVVTGVAFDPERRAVVRYGGLPMDSNDCVPETWEWRRDEWSQLDADPPTACDHMFLVRDTTRDRTLLFGGGDDAGNLIGETWAFDGTRWRLLTDEGPSGRALRLPVRPEPRPGAALRRLRRQPRLRRLLVVGRDGLDGDRLSGAWRQVALRLGAGGR
jgi:hypothetical protein